MKSKKTKAAKKVTAKKPKGYSEFHTKEGRVHKGPFPTVTLAPGPNVLEQWLGRNSDLFNVTRVELLAILPSSSLRQVVTGKRKMSWKQYEALQEGLLPKLLEGAYILQNYGRDFIEKPITG